MNKINDLRVWWIPQIPMKSFYVSVESVKEAKKIMEVLAKYDDFEFKNRVKPDYLNTGGLHEFDGNEWLDWECEECFEDIDNCLCSEKVGVDGSRTGTSQDSAPISEKPKVE